MQTGATTPNIVAPTMLGVVLCVLAVVCKRMQQLQTSLGPAVHRGKNATRKCVMSVRGPNNVVAVRHAHYARFTKTYGLYYSHNALQVPTLLGVVASVCTPLPTRTQQLPTLLAQQFWELLLQFARSLRLSTRCKMFHSKIT